jgi:type II secretory pathway component PulF
MGVGQMLNNELAQWGVLAITLIIVMIILTQFKDVTGNSTTTNSTVDSFVTGLSEPANWVAIFVIAAVGFAIIGFVRKKKG